MDNTDSPGGYILLVDDERDLLQAIAEFLTAQGYAVDAVEDPGAALDLLDQKVFDLVVTDYRLPGLSGIELLKRVKQRDPDIEVIIITGYGSKESVLEALKLGVYDFIEKPFDAVELLKSIVNCLETIRLKRRIDHLIEDLHRNRRDLERAVEARDTELHEKVHCLERMQGVVERLETVAGTIGESGGRIWNDVAVCRRRRQSYLADVSRLIATCGRETRRIASGVAELEAVTREMAAGLQERLGEGDEDGRKTAWAPVPKETAIGDAGDEGSTSERVDAALDEVDDRETDAVYEEMRQFVRRLLQAVADDAPPDLDPARRLIGGILARDGALDALYRKAIYSGGGGEAWDLDAAVVTHSVNVAVYAVKLGEGLGCDAERLARLGLAALVHDVGMVSLPPDLLVKEAFDEADREALRRHPLRGRDYLMKLGEPDRWLAEVVAQEHEREDGSGYPHGLKGGQIRDEARIIGLVDTYAGLTRSRPGRRGLPPFEAVKEITQTHRARFSPGILRAMLHTLSAFPIGSLVRLNSGTVGQVVETLEAYPLRPVIRPLYGVGGRPIQEDRTLALRDNPILHISGVVYPEDLQRLRP